MTFVYDSASMSFMLNTKPSFRSHVAASVARSVFSLADRIHGALVRFGWSVLLRYGTELDIVSLANEHLKPVGLALVPRGTSDTAVADIFDPFGDPRDPPDPEDYVN